MPKESKKNQSIFSLLATYWKFVLLLSLATILGNGLGLFIPKLISQGIDTYASGEVITSFFYTEFLVLAFAVFLLTYFQGIFQTYLSERAARDIRGKLANKISRMSYAQLENETQSKLLTNFTSDIDAVKTFLAMAIATLIASVVVIIGAAGLLLYINWKLALAVLTLLPAIGLVFFFVFRKLGPLFKKGQEIIDGFNTIISESVIGAAIVRVFNSGKFEHDKFNVENNRGRENGMSILRLFSFVIPIVGIIANLASLIILLIGGKFVIAGTMTLGDFTAFNSYVFILIFPIIMLGFISSIISRAQTSYKRLNDVFNLEDFKDSGTLHDEIRGDIQLKNAILTYGERKVLKDVSFSLPAGTKTAIIGPTAAGKTQLLHVLIGLTDPTSGAVLYDGKPLKDYSKKTIHSQVALVFQDSVMFNMSIRENIAFSATANDMEVHKAIETAELSDLVENLPKGLETIVSERGTSLSGGQKQRIMLARALALNPKVLLLDDFTARVDAQTEKKILSNVLKNYPGITLVSVTQKIQSVEHFDKIILLMEGEVMGEGTHAELVTTSPEYVQIMESQKSTQAYE